MSKTTLTREEVHQIVSAQRPCSMGNFRRWLKKLNIQHVGIKTSPLRYSLDTPAKILQALGEPRIVTLAQLKVERAKAQKSRRAA